MSNQAITWAYKQSGLKPGPKFVLVTLGNYADDKSECFPSIETLASDCGMHRSTVIDAIKKLESAERLEVIHRGGDGGGRKSNVYRLACSPLFVGNVGKTDSASKVGNSDGLSRNLPGAKSEIPTRTPIEPSDEPSITPYSPPSPAREVFDYWRQVMDHPRAKLDSKRRNAINARLKEGRSVEDLKRAVDGCSVTPHNMGQNKHRQRYDDIELICRNSPNVERFMGNAERMRKKACDVDAWLDEDSNVIDGECEHEHTRQAAVL